MKRTSGFTLVEVVVALLLMGSILAGSLLAFSRHRRQLSMAEKRLEATMIADQLVTQLSAERGGIRAGQQGPVPGQPGWVWQTSAAGTAELATVALRIVRIEIREISPQTAPLATVEIVQPLPVP